MTTYRKDGLFTQTHGMSHTKPHRAWQGMKERCTNVKRKDYKHYGGRGITYEKRWGRFEAFWHDMKEGYTDGLELDRADNNKGYSKENCRWVTRKEQVNNTRRCHLITYQGTTLNIMQWAQKLGIPHQRIRNRLSSKVASRWTVEKIFTTPPMLNSRDN